MKRRLCSLLLLAAWTALLLGGCFGRPLGQPEKPAGGYEVKDSTGYVLRLPQKPQRIVSLSIGTDEILLALVPAERIAALTYWVDDGGISNVTEEAKGVPGRVKASAETILGLQPDLVIIPDWQPAELVQILRDAGLAVYVYNGATTVEQIKQAIAGIARVVGEEAAGARVAAQMDSELAVIGETVRQIPAGERQVAVRFTLMGGSGGRGSTFDDICRYAGVENGAAMVGLDGDGSLSKEQIIAINPDLLIMPTWDFSGQTDMQQFKKAVQEDPALQPVKAVRQQRLIFISDRYLYCSSQYIVQGVRALAEAAYPKYFGPP
ncbi:MAG TPA: ABC transporter substrate-binding protein [Selenomonadales bacterium]|nr:ABC transporter substrate-binding protein [Selenomonadales bacterium]